MVGNRSTEESTSRLGASDFLRFLDAEINAIGEQEKQPGWTMWAMVVALGGLAWLVTEEFLRHKFQVDTVIRLVLVATSAFLSLGLLLLVFDVPLGQNPLSPRRFELANRQHDRAVLLIPLFSSLAYLSWRFAGNAKAPYVYLAISTYVFIALVTFLFLLVRALGVPLERGATRTSRHFIFGIHGIFSLAFGLIAVGFAEALAEASQQPRLIDVRLGVMLSAILFLSIQVLTYTTPPPLLAALIQIRREIALGQTTLEDGVQKAEVAFLGLRATDVLQEDVKDVLEVLTYMNRELRQGMELLDKVASDLSTEQATAEEKAAIALRLRAAQAYRKDALKGQDEFRKGMEKIERRIHWAALKVRDRPAETILSLIGMLNEPSNRWSQGLKDFDAKYDSIRQRAKDAGITPDQA